MPTLVTTARAGGFESRTGAQARGSDRWLVGLLLAFVFLACCIPLYDTDFWWHLRTGEIILDTGKLPVLDWYTFTDHTRPWIDLHWGFQILLALAYRAGGANLIIVGKAAIITLAVALSLCASGNGLPAWLKTLLWLPAVVAITGRGYERPEALTQLFLAAWLLIAHAVETRPRLIWLLPAIQLVWTNCHALFVLGPVVGACYLADAVARDLLGGRLGLAPPGKGPPARTLIYAGSLAFLACFANPWFEEGALFPLTLYRKFSAEQEFYSVNIGEFQQPIQFLREWKGRAFTNIYFDSELVLWLLATGSFLWLALARRRVSLFRLLLFAGFSHLAWEANRNTNIFAIVAGVVLCRNWGEARQPGARSPGAPVAGPPTSAAAARWMRVEFATGLLWVGLIAAVVTGWWNHIGERNRPFGLGETRDWYIHEPAKFAGREGMPARAIVANNGQAAVYIYHNAPGRFVFMDGRLEVCTRATFEAYNRIRYTMGRGNPAWQQAFGAGRGELPVVVIDIRSRYELQGMLNMPGWRLVFADRTGAVFLHESKARELELAPADPAPLGVEYSEAPP